MLLTFAAGAGLGGMLTKIYGIHAIWFSCLLLIISFCIMFIKEEVEKALYIQKESKYYFNLAYCYAMLENINKALITPYIILGRFCYPNN